MAGPVIVVVVSGGCVDLTAVKNNPHVDAILYACYPGQSGGQGIADVIFGAYNPAGRLTQTWYPASFINLTMYDMGMRPNASDFNLGCIHLPHSVFLMQLQPRPPLLHGSARVPVWLRSQVCKHQLSDVPDVHKATRHSRTISSTRRCPPAPPSTPTLLFTLWPRLAPPRLAHSGLTAPPQPLP